MNNLKKEDANIQDFIKLNIVLGTILSASINEKAKIQAYILTIDFGTNVGLKKTSAQITNYSLDELIGKQVVGVCNLPSKNVAGLVSEVLILGAMSGKKISLLQADKLLENGTIIG
jgi:tRNA-binding protein